MINIKETENQKVYFTSDLHLNHGKSFVYESRGYSSVKEHNDIIINNINNIVRYTDILFNLGDFTLNSSIGDFENFISRINCQTMYMLFGNHANRHFKEIYKPLIKQILGENYTEDSEIYPIKYKNIIYIGNYAEIIINKQLIILSHYPIYIWNHMSGGSWHLTGHSHGGCEKTNPNTSTEKILDVGLDCHDNKPWSFDEIKTFMNKKQFVAVDKHHI